MSATTPEVVRLEVAHRKAAKAYAKVAMRSPDSPTWQRRARELRHAAIALVDAIERSNEVECVRCGFRDTLNLGWSLGGGEPVCPGCADNLPPPPPRRLRFIIMCHNRADDTRVQVLKKNRKPVSFANARAARAEAQRLQVAANKATPGGLPAAEGTTGFPFNFYAMVAP